MCDFWHFSKSFDTCGLVSSVFKVFLPGTQAVVGPGVWTAGSSVCPAAHWQIVPVPSHTLLAPVHVDASQAENNGRSCFCRNWHEGGHFPPPFLFGSEWVSWFFIKHFQTFLEVKIDINQFYSFTVYLLLSKAHLDLLNQVILTLCQAHWVL